MDYQSVIDIVLGVACCLNSIACIFNAKALLMLKPETTASAALRYLSAVITVNDANGAEYDLPRTKHMDIEEFKGYVHGVMLAAVDNGASSFVICVVHHDTP